MWNKLKSLYFRMCGKETSEIPIVHKSKELRSPQFLSCVPTLVQQSPVMQELEALRKDVLREQYRIWKENNKALGYYVAA